MEYTGKDFYNLIKIRFADCLDQVYSLTNMTKDKDINKVSIAKRLSNNIILGTTLISLFSFYAGRILEDSEETGLYTGPAQHRVHTILSDYVNDACLLNTINKNWEKKNPTIRKQTRKSCYNDLNSLGLSKDYAKKFLAKRA